ncbi:MAG: Fic family protein [Cyclobacteriaceae bacterium]|jgi:Fic family protein
MNYNWQQVNWPNFQYSISSIEDIEAKFFQRSGRTTGLIEGLTEKNQNKTLVDIMVIEAMKSFEIEGEYLSRKDVMSSIKNNLGFNNKLETVKDKKSKGAADLMVDVRKSFAAKLTQQKLFDWHKMIVQDNTGIKVGKWRDHAEPMQVVSGALGKEKIHFEAPPSSIVPNEMRAFISWFNNTAPGQKNEIKTPITRAAIAHLYFETIHPFEDGNGRIGRVLSEKALSQGLGHPILLSISKTIESNKNAYYGALKNAQRTTEITKWLKYFANTILDAQKDSEERIEFSLKKSKFFDKRKAALNDRQFKAVNRMLTEGPKGFEGGMTAGKYISLTRASKATATRDLQGLVRKGIFVPSGGGRSTSYDINID